MSAENVIPIRAPGAKPRRRIDWFKVAVWLGITAWTFAVYFLAGVGLAYLAGWLA